MGQTIWRYHIRYERLSWVPVLLVFLVALGFGGKNLSTPPSTSPTTAAAALSFASVIAGFVLTYSPLASDYTTYMDPNVNRWAWLCFSEIFENAHGDQSWRIFFWSYLGFLLPIVRAFPSSQRWFFLNSFRFQYSASELHSVLRYLLFLHGMPPTLTSPSAISSWQFLVQSADLENSWLSYSV